MNGAVSLFKGGLHSHTIFLSEMNLDRCGDVFSPVFQDAALETNHTFHSSQSENVMGELVLLKMKKTLKQQKVILNTLVGPVVQY